MEKWFQFRGLSKPKSVTFMTRGQDHFWPKCEITQDQFNELWDYCQGHEYEGRYGLIKYTNQDKNGEPLNSVWNGVFVDDIKDIPKNDKIDK